MKLKHTPFLLLAFLTFLTGATTMANANENLERVRYGTEKVNGINIFYREAGNANSKKPTLVLLHGFPSSSHQYREVLAELGDDFHIIAPDYPGYGNSDFPSVDEYEYTFDNVAETMDKFLIQRGIDKYVLMIQDFGAPVGFRIATKHPEKVKGFVVMNGNAYAEGIAPEGWGPVLDYWKTKTPELEATIKANVFTLEGMKWQYTHGTRNPHSINPDNWVLDYYNISREGGHDMALTMFFDYQNNLKLYPQWQQYLRENQPPMLIVWGKNDAFFPVAGAEGYKRDVKDIDYHILDTGHFALEEEAPFIINKMRSFMHTKVK